MIARLDTGSWNDAALTPAALNTASQGLGDTYNAVGGFFISPPAFASYAPGPYPRAFPKGSPLPT
jgi:hypothetical protein